MKGFRFSVFDNRVAYGILIASIFLSGLLGTKADTVQARLKQDLAVGAAHDVQLKSGQVVQVMKQSGDSVVIMVQMPDGSSGVFQIKAADLETMPSNSPPAGSVSPPTTNNSAPVQPAMVAPTSPKTPLEVKGLEPVAADPNLPEDQVTLIHVSWPEDSKLPAPFTDFDPAKAGSYSYRLYLPPGYYSHPNFHYPTLFIMSPDGNASLGTFETRARKEGWIVVMFVEARNGDWGPIYGDMLATFADVTAKVRIQKGLQFATGFSGGGRATSEFSQFCPGFDGELLQGAGYALDDGQYHLEGIPHDHPYAVFMTMGLDDSNFHELSDFRAQLHGIPFKSVTFQGGHMWAPEAQFNEGLDWLIEQALSGDAPSDEVRACAARQFLFLAQRATAETDAAKQADKIQAVIALGHDLNFTPGSPEAAELKKLKESLPLSP